MVYYYYDIPTAPNLDGIVSDILISLMSDKNVCHLRWDADSAICQIAWNTELSTDDKTILDNIVSSNS